jgi:hypothetical protein
LKDKAFAAFFEQNPPFELRPHRRESMREPFFDSRVVVVLYREPWGTTPWTSVEETAIGGYFPDE